MLTGLQALENDTPLLLVLFVLLLPLIGPILQSLASSPNIFIRSLMTAPALMKSYFSKLWQILPPVVPTAGPHLHSDTPHNAPPLSVLATVGLFSVFQTYQAHS